MKNEDIEHLLEKFDHSSLKDFHLVQDDFQLSLSKREDTNVPTPATIDQPTPEPTGETAKESVEPTITAPLVGVVYLAPAPEKPVFKQIGDHVEKGDVVCVVEAMKMINEVKSDLTGTLTKVLVTDGSMVEYDEPLLQIKPD